MIRYPSFRQLVAAVCITLLMATQLLGLHYHRRLHGAGAGHGHAAELHLRDAGVHLAHAAHGHPGSADRAAHPGIDLEIEVIAEGFTPPQHPLSPALVPAMQPGITADAREPLRVVQQRPPCGRPARYALSPPSHAPPASLPA
ncbi:MAG: hypothetical protein QM696_07760 [Steroidobacteraceae bacterium]